MGKRGPSRVAIGLAVLSICPIIFVATEASADISETLGATRALLDAGDYEGASDSARLLLNEVDQPGSSGQQTADVLDLLVEASLGARRAGEDEVLAWARRSVAIRENFPIGKGLALSLSRIGTIYRERGDFEEAITVLERANSFAEQLPDDPKLGRVFSDLADVYYDQGKFDQALPVYRSIVARLEATEPVPSGNLARDLYNVGRCARATGYLEESLDAYTRALGHAEVAFQSDRHPAIALLRNGLGNLLDDMGEYSRARTELELAIEIARESYDSTHPDLADYQNNLGRVLRNLGDYDSAAELYQNLLHIHADGDEALVARLITNMAELFHLSGETDKALGQFERALELKIGRVGEVHAEVASILRLIGDVHNSTGDLGAALDSYQHAASIYRETLSDDNPDISLMLLKLGAVHLARGDLDTAQPLIDEALSLRRRILGDDHPWVAEARVQSALLHLRRGNIDESMRDALAAEQSSREHLALTALDQPEREALRYAATRESGLDAILSAIQVEPTPDRIERAWDAVAQSRSLVLEELATRYEALREQDDSSELILTLRAASRRYANLVVRGPDASRPTDYQEALRQARREREQAELAVARASARSGHQPPASASLKDIQSRLPPGSAMMAWVQFTNVAKPLAARNPNEAHPESAYMALLLTRDDFLGFPMGPANKLEKLIHNWLEEIRSPPADDENSHRRPGQQLREVIWDPVAARLAGVTRLFVVPDGALHLVNLGALPLEENTFLIEGNIQFHRLTSERELLRGESSNLGTGLLAIGGADFDLAENPQKATNSAVQVALRGARTSCRSWREFLFSPLPFTLREVEQVSRLWRESMSPGESPVDILEGARATESAFKRRAPGHRYIHLATHGFFLSSSCAMEYADKRGIGTFGPARTSPSPTPLMSLRLSGLALAGANQRATAVAGEDDGVLTAQEIVSMDLASVEWAVLSACETGLGTIQSGEGVLGLQRAFRTAGVRTVIMSLWSVDDQATLEWMTQLYTQRLVRKRDVVDSVHQASMLVLQERRQKKRSTHPFYWAAFVSNGKWQ